MYNASATFCSNTVANCGKSATVKRLCRDVFVEHIHACVATCIEGDDGRGSYSDRSIAVYCATYVAGFVNGLFVMSSSPVAVVRSTICTSIPWSRREILTDPVCRAVWRHVPHPDNQ